MDMKAARFPDHEHSHKHSGSYSQSFTTREPHSTIEHFLRTTGGNVYYKSGLQQRTNYAEVDFSRMQNSAAEVSRIHGSGIELTNSPNDLYPQHMRVYFIFKCA